MQAAFITRVTFQTLSLAMGSFAIFCLYWAGQVSDLDVVKTLLANTFILGGVASALAYSVNEYLT